MLRLYLMIMMMKIMKMSIIVDIFDFYTFYNTRFLQAYMFSVFISVSLF